MHKNAEYHLTRHQLDSLVQAATTIRNRALMVLLIDTALRRFEAGELCVGDIDSEGRLLVVRKGKGGVLRFVPVSARLAKFLQPLLARPAAAPLFATPQNTPLCTRQINRIVAQVGKRAGVENPNPRYRNVTCHLLRHSFARLWKEAGGNIETLAKILGHVSVKTTWDLYGTQSIEDVKRHYNGLIDEITGPKSRRPDRGS